MAKKVTTPENTYTLTKEQVKQLTDLQSELSIAREKLGDLEGEDSISTIMFNVGSAYTMINEAEDKLDKITTMLYDQWDIDEEPF